MLEAILAVVGVVGTACAIYQTAVIRESRKRGAELQYLLAGIHQLTLAMQLEWRNQISLLPSPPQTESQLEILRLHVRAADNASEIASAISALEGVISSDTSAIKSMLQKTIDQAELNNQLQEAGLKNPALTRALEKRADPTESGDDRADSESPHPAA